MARRALLGRQWLEVRSSGVAMASLDSTGANRPVRAWQRQALPPPDNSYRWLTVDGSVPFDSGTQITCETARRYVLGAR